MIRRPPRSTLSSSSAASDVYKRQVSTQSTGRLVRDMCATTVAICSQKRQHSALQSLETNMYSSPEPVKRPRRPWRAVALDNDETTGCWGAASVLYMLWLHLLGRKPSVTEFVDKYLARGGARPGVIKLMRELATLVAHDQLDEVVMFTAASNQEGWVSFLKECLEQYAGTPGLFGRVLSREDITAVAPDGRMLKDLSLVSPDAEYVVLLDDKPQYAWKGFVIGVPEYRTKVPVDLLTHLLGQELAGSGDSTAQEQSSPDQIAKIQAVIELEQQARGEATDSEEDVWLDQALHVIRGLFVRT
eukprot:TRINITY_DN2252_c0_g1_i4.p1 TRINITY_DN2252_c0_g1~~TRINITY_DN2252_c0_g1_i4.p1  ORF type:complete len:302 (+),score=73.06 TRINITY_DN2252_c0_g1_i4:83-988(+)